jgi:WhiB family redox-sensing transcriptional regulator
MTDTAAQAARQATYSVARRRPVVSLPDPLADEWNWQLQARCRGMDSAIFFPKRTRSSRLRQKSESEAKAVCRSCPVVQSCRQYAVDAGETHGIWGGMNIRERTALE